MAMEMNGNTMLSMVSSHEDRIQRLESVTSELASSVAEHNATMRAFGHQMKMMTDSMVEKLDDVSIRLGDKIGTVADISRELATEVKQHTNQLQEFASHKSAVVRSSLLKTDFAVKLGVGISTGVMGFLGHLLWTIMGHTGK